MKHINIFINGVPLIIAVCLLIWLHQGFKAALKVLMFYMGLVAVTSICVELARIVIIKFIS